MRPLRHDDIIKKEERKAATHVLYRTKDILQKKQVPLKPMKPTFKGSTVNNGQTVTKVSGKERVIEVHPVVPVEIFRKYDKDMSKGIFLLSF